jgi:hypothetical protein
MIVEGGAIGTGQPSVLASLWNFLSRGLHKAVLVRIPNAVAFVFEHLSEPFAIGLTVVFEKTKERKVRVGQMTIHLDATTNAIGTSIGIPCFGVEIVILVFANATAFIVEINVL